ncbi:hypothetical protein B0H12DRAFT_1245988 [Mycena haematopus]|nr:hypothetical protein B0H12DRAFT_1245988 [Mycena haematopus]
MFSQDATTAKLVIPPAIPEFLRSVAAYRELQRSNRSGLNVTIGTSYVTTRSTSATPSKTTSTVKESQKRPRGESLHPSDIESEEGDELPGEDVPMEDVSKKTKGKAPSSQEPAFPPPPESDSEVELIQKPPKKKVVTRSQKSDTPAPVIDAPTGPRKSFTTVPKEGEDALSYDQVLKILDEANALVGRAAKIPHTVDGLQRMDCAIRTHLSQIAIRISIEVAKYDAVFVEYKRISAIMEARSVGHKDHSIFETEKPTVQLVSNPSTFPTAHVSVAVAVVTAAVAVAVVRNL